VQRLVTRDVSRLAVGQAGYAAVCLPSGGTVDDVLVYRTPDDFLIVVNASNREKDVAHFEENVKDLDVEVVDDSDDWALLALQGPRAVELLQPFTQTELSPIKYYRYEVGEVEGAYAIISRTGYTGEDGFELFVRPDDAPLIWRKLIDAGAAPVGLGARDTLRLEAGMCLYGNELDAETTPLEAGIGFAVHLDKEQEFLGKEALRREKEEGLRKKLVGFKVEGRGIARHDYPVAVDGETVGSVTSGTPVAARTVPLPFYKRDKK
jgi:aminomethyltransferase